MQLSEQSTKRAYDAAKSARWRARNLEKAREHTRLWRAKDPDRTRELGRRARAKMMATPEGRMRHTVNQARRRARLSGLDFNITLADLLPLPTHCPVFGTRLNYRGTGDRKGFVGDSPSIDRVDSSLGYVKGNVRVISWRANRLKADATITELKQLLTYLGVSCS